MAQDNIQEKLTVGRLSIAWHNSSPLWAQLSCCTKSCRQFSRQTSISALSSRFAWRYVAARLASMRSGTAVDVVDVAVAANMNWLAVEWRAQWKCQFHTRFLWRWRWVAKLSKKSSMRRWWLAAHATHKSLTLSALVWMLWWHLELLLDSKVSAVPAVLVSIPKDVLPVF